MPGMVNTAKPREMFHHKGGEMAVDTPESPGKFHFLVEGWGGVFFCLVLGGCACRNG